MKDRHSIEDDKALGRLMADIQAGPIPRWEPTYYRSVQCVAEHNAVVQVANDLAAALQRLLAEHPCGRHPCPNQHCAAFVARAALAKAGLPC